MNVLDMLRDIKAQLDAGDSLHAQQARSGVVELIRLYESAEPAKADAVAEVADETPKGKRAR